MNRHQSYAVLREDYSLFGQRPPSHRPPSRGTTGGFSPHTTTTIPNSTRVISETSNYPLFEEHVSGPPGKFRTSVMPAVHGVGQRMHRLVRSLSSHQRDPYAAEENFFTIALVPVMTQIRQLVIYIWNKLLNADPKNLAQTDHGRVALVGFAILASEMAKLWTRPLNKTFLTNIGDMMGAVGNDIDEELQEFAKKVAHIKGMLATGRYAGLKLGDHRPPLDILIVPAILLRDGTTVEGLVFELGPGGIFRKCV